MLKFCAREWTCTQLRTLDGGRALGIMLLFASERRTRQKPVKPLKVLVGKKVQSSFMEISDSEQRRTPMATSGQGSHCQVDTFI